jgi:hypothetical protein
MFGKWAKIPYESLPVADAWSAVQDLMHALRVHFDSKNCSLAPGALVVTALTMYQRYIYRNAFIVYGI